MSTALDLAARDLLACLNRADNGQWIVRPGLGADFHRALDALAKASAPKVLSWQYESGFVTARFGRDTFVIVRRSGGLSLDFAGAQDVLAVDDTPHGRVQLLEAAEAMAQHLAQPDRRELLPAGGVR